jgi:hypothetical protein
LEEVGLCGLVIIKKSNIFFVTGWDGIFHKQNKKCVLTLVFHIRDSSPRLQFPLFDKRVWDMFGGELVIRFDQGMLNQELIQIIPEDFIIGSLKTQRPAQFFSKPPVCHILLRLSGRV